MTVPGRTGTGATDGSGPSAGQTSDGQTSPGQTSPGQTSPGMLIPGGSVPVPQRAGARRALDIEGLAAAVKAKLASEQANNSPDGSPRPFTAAEFGLQMVEGVASVRFTCQQPQAAL